MKLKVFAVATAVAAAGALAMAQTPQSHGSPVGARADIKGKGISGTADFTEHEQSGSMMVELSLNVTGLTPGKHGVHLHAVGKCEPDFTAAGGHFDPGPASNTDPDANHPFHMGDIPN
nr:superoxide dismutase family protein [Acidobacteriota bacterium]